MIGCGGGVDLPELYQLSGIVTHQGKPIPNAVIVMTSTSGGRPSYGNADENGHFTMAYTQDAPGVTAGENLVTLMEPSPTPDQMEPPKELKPLYEKYAEGASTLKINIDKNQSDFELKLD